MILKSMFFQRLKNSCAIFQEEGPQWLMEGAKKIGTAGTAEPVSLSENRKCPKYPKDISLLVLLKWLFGGIHHFQTYTIFRHSHSCP